MSIMTLRAALLASVLAASSFPSLVNAAFISGVWQGDANFDAKGDFSDCTMTAQAKSGVFVGFIISKNFKWGLFLADETRQFDVGTTETVLLHIDKRDPITATSKAIDVHGILIPLENSEYVLEAFREGKVLTITAGRGEISFKLTGTKAAIAELAACVTENLNRAKADAGSTQPFSFASLAPSAP
jgi:hypothetical protein